MFVDLSFHLSRRCFGSLFRTTHNYEMSPIFGRRRFIPKTRQYNMEELEQICNISLERMRSISAYVQDQMDRGLRGEPSDLKMLPSFVDSICTGMRWIHWMMRRNGAGVRDGSGYGRKQRACDQVQFARKRSSRSGKGSETRIPNGIHVGNGGTSLRLPRRLY